MRTAKINSPKGFSVTPRSHGVSRGLLPSILLAFALAGVAPAQAVMGESDATVGLLLNEERVVTLGCGLGDACDIDGVFFRSLQAERLFRGGPELETDIEISGFAFGSIMSVERQDFSLADFFCWSGDRRRARPKDSKGVRDCIEIFEGDGSNSGGTVVTTRQSVQECNETADRFVGPLTSDPPEFKYLIRIFEDRYGEPSSVEVVTCAGVVAQLVPDNVVREGVVVKAHRSGDGYNPSSWGGRYI